jgi:peptidoglycan/LPS O-acetylase OafA/YrhL
MDSFVIFWGLSILLFISIIVGLIYLAYWLPKRLGKRKLGLWLSGILTVGLLILIMATVFEDQFFFNSHAKEKLKEHNIELIDDFKLHKFNK